MWAWHAPALFDRALDSRGWHIAQHLSFVLRRCSSGSAMLDPRRGGYLLSAACLFLTSLVEGALGALMALSQSPWYSAYAAMGMSGIGLDPDDRPAARRTGHVDPGRPGPRRSGARASSTNG